MIPKQIHQIGFADLQALIGQVPESRTLEYKRQMQAQMTPEKIKFLAAVSSLANTAGGDLLIGVDAKNGVPVAIPGITVTNMDAEKLRFEQLLATCIEPRIPRVEIEAVACPSGASVLVIRAHRSWLAPHRVTLNDKFYGRNSGGNYPLDVTELRSAFVLSESAAEKIRTFRNDRLIKIAAGETSFPIPDRPLIVLHVVPFSTFAGVQTIDPVAAVANGHVVPIPIGRWAQGNQSLVNLDGFATIAAPTDGLTHAYAQLFRSGALEAVDMVNHDGQKSWIASPTFENRIVEALRNYLMFYKAIDAGLPIFIFLSLIGMGRCSFRTPAQFTGSSYYDYGPLRTDVVALPEATVDGEPADIPRIMRSSFNTVWNAFGMAQSDKYDAQGKWIGTG